MQKFLSLLLAVAVALSSDIAMSDINVNGQAKKMQFEKLSTAPTASEARVYYDTDDKKPFIYNGTDWTGLGAGGSGSGFANWIENPDAEDVTIVGMTTYDDGAVAAPVDCAGGSPSTLTLTRNDTNEILGEADYSLVKSAVNGQGEGLAIEVNMDTNDPAVVASWSARFGMWYFNSVDYASSDIGVYAYDAAFATTPVLIGNLSDSTQTVVYDEGWTTRVASGQYLICFHVQSTNASAYTLKFDRLYAGIEKGFPAPTVPYEGWTAFTPSWDADTPARSVNTGFYRRVGDSMELEVDFTASGAGTGEISMTLPGGFSFDATKIGAYHAAQSLGFGVFQDTGTTLIPINVAYNSATTIVFIKSNAAADTVDGVEFANTDTFGFKAVIPISEWANPSYSATSGNCEYATTSGTWDLNSSTTVFGSNGAAMGGALTDARVKTITFANPVRFLKVYLGDTTSPQAWMLAGQAAPNGGRSMNVQGTAGTEATGSGVYVYSTGTNTAVVNFNRYKRVAPDDNPVVDWSTADRWVVENCPTSAGSITFALATDTKPGLITREKQGTFTTTLLFGGASGCTTYDEQAGHYYVLGSRVFVDINIQCTTLSAATGTATLGGLPYASTNADANYRVTCGAIWHTGLDINTAGGFSNVMALMTANDAVISLYEVGDNVTGVVLTHADFANGEQIELSCSYITDEI